MCNRVVQNDVVVKPGGKMTVLMRGPGGEFELPFDEAVFGGPAKRESRNYWLKREGAVDVLVPHVSRFGEKNKTTGEQGWEDVPAESALEGLLLPQPPGKEYRLLKIVTQPATPDQLARLGNGRDVTLLLRCQLLNLVFCDRTHNRLAISVAAQRCLNASKMAKTVTRPKRTTLQWLPRRTAIPEIALIIFCSPLGNKRGDFFRAFA